MKPRRITPQNSTPAPAAEPKQTSPEQNSSEHSCPRAEARCEMYPVPSPLPSAKEKQIAHELTFQALAHGHLSYPCDDLTIANRLALILQRNLPRKFSAGVINRPSHSVPICVNVFSVSVEPWMHYRELFPKSVPQKPKNEDDTKR